MKRVVNIYNFVRAVEPRFSEITPDVLLETTATQIRLIRKHRLPATFALQYDALIDPRYQKLLCCEQGEDFEIGGWWEIVQPLVEKAGLTWRGRFPWDWHANVGFSPGYTPEEREKLVDVYMEDFKSIFGAYPLTVGSWFIDTHTLRYLSEKYHIVASCNCKDQVGTDGYTLWGGYWNQGYYPSKNNVYIPAQDAAEQIPVPIFRMLGSDPIYQYDDGLGTSRQNVISLEPVYGSSGGDPNWVRWFFGSMTEEPCLAFGYAQAGQENSFTWDKMATGYEFQIAHITKLVDAGKLTAQTMATTGKWFRSRFSVTPATAVTATHDWKNEGRQTVWYNSRFYRMNLLWEPEGFRVRDIHLFHQEYPDPYLDAPLTSSACRYDALPVMDGFHWSRAGTLAGIRLVKLDGTSHRSLEVGSPCVSEKANAELFITCPVKPQGKLEIHCMEEKVSFRFTGMPQPAKYALSLAWSRNSNVPFNRIDPQALVCSQRGFHYRVACDCGHFETRAAADHSPEEKAILIVPDEDIVFLDFATARN